MRHRIASVIASVRVDTSPVLTRVVEVEDPSDLLDLSKLSDAALDKAKQLTMDDIRNLGWSSALSDYHLMANVINLKADWDSDDEPKTVTVEGEKTWKDDNDEANARPETITIRLKANGKATRDGEGKELVKEVREDDKGNWTWTFEDLDKEDEKTSSGDPDKPGDPGDPNGSDDPGDPKGSVDPGGPKGLDDPGEPKGIDDPANPDGPSDTENPVRGAGTGDNVQISLLLMAMLAAMGPLTVLFYWRRKGNNCKS